VESALEELESVPIPTSAAAPASQGQGDVGATRAHPREADAGAVLGESADEGAAAPGTPPHGGVAGLGAAMPVGPGTSGGLQGRAGAGGGRESGERRTPWGLGPQCVVVGQFWRAALSTVEAARAELLLCHTTLSSEHSYETFQKVGVLSGTAWLLAACGRCCQVRGLVPYGDVLPVAT